MKEYTALVSIMAENEADFFEQLEALDSYELEWWKEGKESENDAIAREIKNFLEGDFNG